MNAIVLINKPVDCRSTKCVAAVKRKLDVKVGHAGTLDSTASGLLVLLTGSATRFCEYVMSLPKVYRTVIQFGKETNTYDYSGETLSEKGYSEIDGRIFDQTLFSFLGKRMQTPPPVSAIKIEGQPAYKLARSGVDVEIKSRPVFFKKINVLRPYNPDDGTLELEIHCGRGTYIRTLAHDLGKISGCGGYVKSLERVSTGLFRLEDACSLEDDEIIPLPLSKLAENFTGIYVNDKDSASFTNGMSILLRHAARVRRGISVNGSICVEGDDFLGFGSYAGYDYVKPDVIVPKDGLW